MDLRTYKKITAKWKGKKYQTWDKVSTRLDLLGKILDDLEGKSFLEIGANAGIVAHEVAPYVSKYVGVEADLHFYRQALNTRKHAKHLGDVSFYNRTFGRFAHKCEEKFDVIYTSNVLYYLREKELKILKEEFLPHCQMMINVFRARKKKDGRNHQKLYTCENIAKCFDEFKFKVYEGSQKKLFMMVGTK